MLNKFSPKDLYWFLIGIIPLPIVMTFLLFFSLNTPSSFSQDPLLAICKYLVLALIVGMIASVIMTIYSRRAYLLAVFKIVISSLSCVMLLSSLLAVRVEVRDPFIFYVLLGTCPITGYVVWRYFRDEFICEILPKLFTSKIDIEKGKYSLSEKSLMPKSSLKISMIISIMGLFFVILAWLRYGKVNGLSGANEPLLILLSVAIAFYALYIIGLGYSLFNFYICLFIRKAEKAKGVKIYITE